MGSARIYPWRKMHRSRAPSIAPGTFFVVQSWADCITNMAGFNLRQAQARISWMTRAFAVARRRSHVHVIANASEAIHLSNRGSMDCFVACAPRNDSNGGDAKSLTPDSIP